MPIFYLDDVSFAVLPTELTEDLVAKGLSVDVICGYPKKYYSGGKVPSKEQYKGIRIYRANLSWEFRVKKIIRITKEMLSC